MTAWGMVYTYPGKNVFQAFACSISKFMKFKPFYITAQT